MFPTKTVYVGAGSPTIWGSNSARFAPMDISKGLLKGDCLEQLKKLPDNSVDSIVTDPPYGLEFLDKSWDSFKGAGKVERADEGMDESHPFRDGAPRIEYGFGGEASANFQKWFTEIATECLRVLKPGGHILAFGASRTYHRLACAVEDAGFEIRDSIHWTYGTGFPKSMDISKQLDKKAGVERTEVIGSKQVVKATDSREDRPNVSGYGIKPNQKGEMVSIDVLAPATPEAKEWSGWGTALKPSHEPIVVGRKPLEGTVATNVLKYGTGGLNIDGTRVPTNGETIELGGRSTIGPTGEGWGSAWQGDDDAVANRNEWAQLAIEKANDLGRWAANTILTHDPNCGKRCEPSCPIGEIDSTHKDKQGGVSRFFNILDYGEADYPAFLYVAKPTKKEKNSGLDGLPEGKADQRDDKGAGIWASKNAVQSNIHPTVKPVALMRHLIRLVTPPNGVVLDPFLGSGTTAVAAILEGKQWVGCEITEDYWSIIKARTEWATEQAAITPQTLL